MSDRDLIKEENEMGVITRVWSRTETKAHRREVVFQGRVSRDHFFCTSCSHKVAIADSFCSGCGSDLRIPGD